MVTQLLHRLSGLFRSKADRTSLKQLERSGVRNVHVLDFARLEEIVGEAMEAALRETLAAGGSAELAAGGAQVEFLRRMGLSERLAARGGELVRQQEALEGQLDSLRGTLAQNKDELAARRKQERDAAAAALRARLDPLLETSFGRIERAAPPVVLGQLRAVLPTLRAALLELLGEALRAGAAGGGDGEGGEVELLERRVRKLNAQLLETQELLERTRATRAQEESGIASIHRTPQGVKGDGADAQAKKALLREIFQHNLELRRTLADPAITELPPR